MISSVGTRILIFTFFNKNIIKILTNIKKITQILNLNCNHETRGLIPKKNLNFHTFSINNIYFFGMFETLILQNMS